jgi:hypothetical protein
MIVARMLKTTVIHTQANPSFNAETRTMFFVVQVTQREPYLGSAGNGDTTLTLVLLTIHVESEGERALAELLGLILQLLHLTLGDSAELEDQTTGGGRFAGIDMAANDNRNVLLTFSHFDDITRN